MIPYLLILCVHLLIVSFDSILASKKRSYQSSSRRCVCDYTPCSALTISCNNGASAHCAQQVRSLQSSISKKDKDVHLMRFVLY